MARTEPMLGFNTDGSDNTSPQYGFEEFRFTSSVATGGSLTINGGSVALDIQDDFQNITTVLNNRTSLGQNFINGVSLPEVKKYSGNIVYVDNRPPITRSSSQKEDIKIIFNSNKKSYFETNLNVVLTLTILILKVTITRFFSNQTILFRQKLQGCNRSRIRSNSSVIISSKRVQRSFLET